MKTKLTGDQISLAAFDYSNKSAALDMDDKSIDLQASADRFKHSAELKMEKAISELEIPFTETSPVGDTKKGGFVVRSIAFDIARAEVFKKLTAAANKKLDVFELNEQVYLSGAEGMKQIADKLIQEIIDLQGMGNRIRPHHIRKTTEELGSMIEFSKTL